METELQLGTGKSPLGNHHSNIQFRQESSISEKVRELIIIRLDIF